MKFYIYTLGCKVNSYESNVMSDLLINNNYVKVDIPSDADIFIINTCTVTNNANNKSLKAIRKANRIKQDSIIVVCGCMSQHEHNDIKNIPNVKIIIGNKNKSKIVDYISKYKKNHKQIIDVYDIKSIDYEEMKLNNFDKTRAFVKIEDGCNNFCSYCVIPYTRGGVRSRKKENIISEIKLLINEGHKEIVLTGIHTGHYNDKGYKIHNLIEDILDIKKLERLRISSIEITEITEELLILMKNNSILVDHMHIPIQSGSDSVLKRMNRKYDLQYYINIINKIRSIRPNISITTDLIVGFPNETETEFEETIKTLDIIKFSKIHVFPFSLRSGTTAEKLSNHIDDKTKKDRVKKIIEISKSNEIEYFNKFLNTNVKFLPETYEDGYLIGHTGNYLLVKAKGCKNLLNIEIEVLLNRVSYPYIIGDIR